MLELKNVSKSFGKRTIIRNLDLVIGKGEVVCLKGSNGAGKSTLMTMIAGVIIPDSGSIYYDGKDIFKNKREYKRKIGYVPQSAALYGELSGMENLKYWGRLQHLKGERLIEQIGRTLDFVGLREEDLKKKTSVYSGGMRQRISIAVAILHNPGLLLLDEPAAGIDEQSRERLCKVLKELNSEGTTILYTGHYRDELEQIKSRWVDLDKFE